MRIDEWMQKRWRYVVKILVVIFLGITSRKVSVIPLYVGDMLYGLMMYYIVCFFRGESGRRSFLYGVGICFMVEFSQLIQWEWLSGVRSTTIGHLILGQGFLYQDLVCYLAGGILGSIIEYCLERS